MNYIYLNINQAEENRIIITRNHKLVDFEQELQGEENQKGNIHTGVVTNVEPSLEAAFVDFGENKNGLLPFREIPPNAFGVSKDGIAPGDKLLVQIKKDNIGDKGAGLTGIYFSCRQLSGAAALSSGRAGRFRQCQQQRPARNE